MIARTKIRKTFDEKEFIDYLMILDPSKKDYEIKNMIKLILRGTRDIITDGNAISITDLFRISPTIKGSFDNKDSGTDLSGHKLGINFTVSKKFLDDLKKSVNVEQTATPRITPEIKFIRDNVTKENCLRKGSANRIRGSYLSMTNCEFVGLSISLKANEEKTCVIDKSGLEIISFSSRVLLFNFTKTFTAPDWLTENSEILLKLRYSPVNGSFTESNVFSTKWAL